MLWFFLSFFLMFFSTNFIPPPWGTYIGGGSIFIMIPGLIVQDAVLRWLLASECHLNATIFPENMKYDLFYNNPPSDDSVKLPDGSYYTRLSLTRPFIYRRKRSKWIFMHHDELWLHKIALRKGFAYYAGMLLQHPVTDNVVLYFAGQVDGERYDPCPVFELKHSGGDYEKWRKQHEIELIAEA